MTHRTTLRKGAAIASTAGLMLALAACSSADSTDTADKPAVDCAPYEQWAGHEDTTVSVYGTVVDEEADQYLEAWEPFEHCTGITLDLQGTGDFEAQIGVLIEGGNAPDIALFPQPGLAQRFISSGDLQPLPQALSDELSAVISTDWLDYGADADGTYYAVPLNVVAKSFVWYSPAMFEENGYEIPETWDELITLTDTIESEQEITPWCVGLESGAATGWPATDWIEDLVLRTSGPEVYDQWVTHEIPFDDPRIAEAWDMTGEILKNPDYVNGGYGDVKSQISIAYQEGGYPILDGECALHRQAAFYSDSWPSDVTVGQDGDVFAFYLPPVDPSKGSPVTVAGLLAGAFTDRPEVLAAQEYLASVEFAQSIGTVAQKLSARSDFDVSVIEEPMIKVSYETLNAPDAVLRFDGSDLMPSNVGAGTFWSGIVDWIGGKNTSETLTYIENSWK